ncbi:hypothetical protein FRACYDRAFT_180192 [Fragilariopsis cylindrus CCMP1102]|uniref:Magnesium transporter n=1 Tax=Fragilariopsis cylindrus CCMP1102 TaxID=635003 RepID=A0A1E7FS47_9STRA|nr:hypothetical protein FRACYDRAFT_180192 [Fragilariopsis cylindrus CCMP1102]|eukprot:OEU20653.1 hypothetical protein FRACYDRAFT_180192 [Fragilariopsis cylindrus CCMP1102]
MVSTLFYSTTVVLKNHGRCTVSVRNLQRQALRSQRRAYNFRCQKDTTLYNSATSKYTSFTVLTRHISSSIKTPIETLSSPRSLHDDINLTPKDTSTVIYSSLQPDDKDESFEVTKIITATGEIETTFLHPSEIMAETTMSPRDFVLLRLTSWNERTENWVGKTLIEQMRHPPTIMARNDFILLTLGPVRAVCEKDVCYFFDVHSEAAKSFIKGLSRVYQERSARIKSKNRDLFLETVLSDTVGSFTGRVRIFEPIVNDLLHRISVDEDFSDANLLHQMAPLKEQLQSFEVYVTQAYDCLTQILNDDEVMLQLLLTEQGEACTANVPVDFERHQHVEHVLGIYARRFSSVIQEVNYLLGRIESKQEFIELELDLFRNRLIKMNVDLAILATATGITTALTGSFGMNMVNGFEDSNTAFIAVAAGSAISALSVAHYFRKMVSGAAIQKRAEQRIDEIQTMYNALSDMSALDCAVKEMMKGKRMCREEFKNQLATARHSKTCSDKEIDLLFNVLNTHEDDFLDEKDFADKKEK